MPMNNLLTMNNSKTFAELSTKACTHLHCNDKYAQQECNDSFEVFDFKQRFKQ